MTDDHRHVPDKDFADFIEEAKVAHLFPERDACLHATASERSRSCPDCGGVLRRCCMSLVGFYEHRESCPESARTRDAA